MTSADIIKKVMADGVTLALSPTGGIKAVGSGAAVNRWLPILREHKAELLEELHAANDGAYEALPDPALETELRYLERLEGRTVTPVTSAKKPDVTPKPAPIKACTPVTPDTARIEADREAFEERAAIMEYDGGLTRAEAERLALLERDNATIH